MFTFSPFSGEPNQTRNQLTSSPAPRGIEFPSPLTNPLEREKHEKMKKGQARSSFQAMDIV
jgi:hypothetical protein